MDYHLTGAEFNTCACLQINKTNSQTRFLGKHKPNLLFTADTSQRIPASRIIWWNNYSGQADALPDLQSHWGPQHKQGWHCKTPVDSTRNGKCFVQLCRACPPLLTVVLRASFLFTPSCIVSAIRVEAVNSPCLKTFKMWQGTAQKKICSSWFWFYFYHRGGTWSPEVHVNPSYSVIVHKETGKRNHESWGLGTGNSCYLWGQLCWILLWYASVHSILTGHCWALPHPAVYQTGFFALHLSTSTSENLIPWAKPRLKLQPHIYKLVLNTSVNFHLVSFQCLCHLLTQVLESGRAKSFNCLKLN